MVIYLDSLFLINLIVDYLIILATARICGLFLRRLRFALAAALGALYACASVFPELIFMQSAPVKICAGALVCLVAFAKEEKLLRTCLCFFAVSALFGGAVWALGGQSSNGGIVSAVSLPVLVLSFGVIYGVLSLVFRRSLKNAERKVYITTISFMGAELKLRALHDSGNALFDPVTGARVLIAGADALSPLLGDKTELFKTGDPTAALADNAFAGRLRLLPYSAVGVSHALLPVFRPDKLILDGKLRDDILVAVSPTATGGDGFDCIV